MKKSISISLSILYSVLAALVWLPFLGYEAKEMALLSFGLLVAAHHLFNTNEKIPIFYIILPIVTFLTLVYGYTVLLFILPIVIVKTKITYKDRGILYVVILSWLLLLTSENYFGESVSYVMLYMSLLLYAIIRLLNLLNIEQIEYKAFDSFIAVVYLYFFLFRGLTDYYYFIHMFFPLVVMFYLSRSNKLSYVIGLSLLMAHLGLEQDFYYFLPLAATSLSFAFVIPILLIIQIPFAGFDLNAMLSLVIIATTFINVNKLYPAIREWKLDIIYIPVLIVLLYFLIQSKTYLVLQWKEPAQYYNVVLILVFAIIGTLAHHKQWLSINFRIQFFTYLDTLFNVNNTEKTIDNSSPDVLRFRNHLPAIETKTFIYYILISTALSGSVMWITYIK